MEPAVSSSPPPKMNTDENPPRCRSPVSIFSSAVDIPGSEDLPSVLPPLPEGDVLTLLPDVQSSGRASGARRPFQRRRRSRACDACRARKTKCDTPDHGPCSACSAASLVCKFSEGEEDRRRAGPARRVRELENTVQELTKKLEETERQLAAANITSKRDEVDPPPPTTKDLIVGLSEPSPSPNSQYNYSDPPSATGSNARGGRPFENYVASSTGSSHWAPLTFENSSVYTTSILEQGGLPQQNLRQASNPFSTTSSGRDDRNESEGNGRESNFWNHNMFGPGSSPSFVAAYKEYLRRLGFQALEPENERSRSEPGVPLVSDYLSMSAHYPPIDLRIYLPSKGFAKRILEVFRRTIQNYCPMFYWPSLEKKLERAWDAPIWEGDGDCVKPVFCIVMMLLAVSSQLVEPQELDTYNFGDWGSTQERNGWKFFDLARTYANLNNPNYTIDDATHLLLMAMYLDRASLPSPCWMISGAMGRVCQDIGLHKTPPLDLFTREEMESRVRLFWTAYAQDRKVSMKMGRPELFRDGDIDISLPGHFLDDGIKSSKPTTPEQDGGGEDQEEIAKQSLQVFRATIYVSRTKQAISSVNLRRNGGEEDMGMLQNIDRKLMEGWGIFPAGLIDLQRLDALDLPALIPLFYLQHSRLLLYRYFTDFSSPADFSRGFRTFCLAQSIQISKVTAHLLHRASKNDYFDRCFGLRGDELTHIHTFRAATILLLGHCSSDPALLPVAKWEVDICVQALRSIAMRHFAGQKLMVLFEGFARMFNYQLDVAQSVAGQRNTSKPPASTAKGKEKERIDPELRDSPQQLPSLPAVSGWYHHQGVTGTPEFTQSGNGDVFDQYQRSQPQTQPTHWPTNDPQNSRSQELPMQARPNLQYLQTPSERQNQPQDQSFPNTTTSGNTMVDATLRSPAHSSVATSEEPQVGILPPPIFQPLHSQLAVGQTVPIDWDAFQQVLQFDPSFEQFMGGPTEWNFGPG